MDLIALQSLARTYYEKEATDSIAELYDSITDIFNKFGNIVFVSSIDDFPAPISGIIYLEPNTEYRITAPINLGTIRLYCSGKNVIRGSSSEIHSITGTPSAGKAMIDAVDSLQLFSITLSTDSPLSYCVRIDGTGKSNVVVDWIGVNFAGGTASHFKNMDSVVMFSCSLKSPANGFYFEGSFNSIVFTLCLLSVTISGGYGIYIDPDAIINRRLRYFDGPIIVTPGNSGIITFIDNFAAPESFILSYVNFSGGGTYIDGSLVTEKHVRWTNCKGITNSGRFAQYYWEDSATVTTISSTLIWVKAANTSTPLAINQRFSHSNNRLTYTSAFTTTFLVTAEITAAAAKSNQLGLRVYKNGVYVPGSQARMTCNGGLVGDRAENVSKTFLVTLSQGDYLEIWIRNYTATTNINCSDGSLIVAAQ